MNKEAIEKLEEYCKWCNAQGGQCQLNLDGCAVGDALAILTEQPPAGEFTNEIRRRLNDIGRMRQLRPIEKSLWNILDRLDRSEAGERILEERIEKLSDTLDRSEVSREDLLTACRQAFNESHNPKVEKILKAAIKGD